MYSGIVLDKESRQRLVRNFIQLIPAHWDIVGHHMTINMGPLKKGPLDETWTGKEVDIVATEVAGNDKVLAVGVETDIPSKNEKKHITLAVNREEGGKPVMSNKLDNWETLSNPIHLSGTILEVK